VIPPKYLLHLYGAAVSEACSGLAFTPNLGKEMVSKWCRELHRCGCIESNATGSQ